MTWKHHYDERGKSDHPDTADFPMLIHHYWTNERGTRIGLFGIVKNIGSFTYLNDELNFTFDLAPSRDGAWGPDCWVILERRRTWSHGGVSTTDLRRELFSQFDLPAVLDEIENFIISVVSDVGSFLDITSFHGRTPPAPAIKHVIFPLENR